MFKQLHLRINDLTIKLTISFLQFLFQVCSRTENTETQMVAVRMSQVILLLPRQCITANMTAIAFCRMPYVIQHKSQAFATKTAEEI